MTTVYLDNNASTAVDPLVVESMVDVLRTVLGNASSVHAQGRAAKAHLIAARNTLARHFGVTSSEIIFTSGATEALNMLLRGYLTQVPSGHIISSNVEHAAVIETLADACTKQHRVSFLPAGTWGAVQPEAVQQAIRPDTCLIVLMAANNETGVKTDIFHIAQIARAHRIPFILDGVGLWGKESFKLPEGVSAACFSGHKIHGPKGSGCAVVRKGFRFSPLITGGGQELGRRGGTEDIASIVGLAKAVEQLEKHLSRTQNVMQLRDTFEARLQDAFSDYVKVNGEGPRIGNTSNLSFEGIKGDTLLVHLDQMGISVSHGAACSSGALEPSRILLNMGLERERVHSSIRFSLSRMTTAEEMERCYTALHEILSTLHCVKN